MKENDQANAGIMRWLERDAAAEEKTVEKDVIFNWFLKNKSDGLSVLYNLMLVDELNITDLVRVKERAMKDRYVSLKGDASEATALVVMYKNHMYDPPHKKTGEPSESKRNLDLRAVTLLDKMGFVKDGSSKK